MNCSSLRNKSSGYSFTIPRMKNFQDHCDRLLKDLIRIPSFQEEQFPGMQEFIMDELRDTGCETFIDKSSGCIIGRMPVNPDAGTVLLSAHFDTVGPTTAWTIDPLKPIEKNGRVYGLGSSDCKGGIVSILAALKKVKPSNNVVAVITGYEDIKKEVAGKQYHGSSLIPDNIDISADFGIVTEASVRDQKFSFINGMFGKIAFSVNAMGKQSHACHPERGENAIYTAMEAVRILKEGLPRETFRYRSENYRETLNVGKIAGGSAVNVVPHECIVEMEHRISPISSLVEKKRIIEDLLGGLNSVELKYNFEYPPFIAEPLGPLHRLVSERLAYPVQERMSRGGTDANIFNARGIPTIVFGPGECDQVHQADEYITFDRVVECADIICGVLEEAL
jgi:acetylornithine deacetylase/succinyl-diaminopimelate desuccinylase-like protein